ncbi:MAG: hypothetical protein MJY72_07085 [Bacteroidales bacterium]|nr:hypothetical protein [Bacteroidales bacterium]
MKKFGLIGHPIAHSKSPALFKAAYDGRYPYDLIEGADFEQVWQRFIDEYDGINVTAPFKELAYARADVRSAECEAIGAGNIFVKTAEGIKAYNSDYSAVAMMLLEAMKEKPMQTAMVIGCGGAGKAAIVAALEVGLKTRIANRNVAKAEEFADSLAAVFGPKKRPEVFGLEDGADALPKCDVVIYTLPLAVKGIEAFSDVMVLEANYKDPVLNAESGKKWLLSQAVHGYFLFTGEEPDAESMAKVFE